MTWPGRETALVKGNLPTVSRACGVPCPATSLPIWQCQNSTVAESWLESHTGGPAILTPFAGASRFPRQSLNGGARAVEQLNPGSDPPCQPGPSNRPHARCATALSHDGGDKKRRPRTLESGYPWQDAPSSEPSYTGPETINLRPGESTAGLLNLTPRAPNHHPRFTRGKRGAIS